MHHACSVTMVTWQSFSRASDQLFQLMSVLRSQYLGTNQNFPRSAGPCPQSLLDSGDPDVLLALGQLLRSYNKVVIGPPL